MWKAKRSIPRDIWLRRELELGCILDLGAAAGVSLVLVARKGRRALYVVFLFVGKRENASRGAAFHDARAAKKLSSVVHLAIRDK